MLRIHQIFVEQLEKNVRDGMLTIIVMLYNWIWNNEYGPRGEENEQEEKKSLSREETKLTRKTTYG